MARDRTHRLGWFPLAGAAALASVGILHLGRGLTFFSDEWSIALERRGWSAGDFLEPVNEHLFLIPVAVFKVLLTTIGMTHYWPYRLMVVAAHLVCVGLVFVVARRRAGDVVALAAALLILFLGSSWENLFLPIQISFLISVACALALLLVLERRTALADVGAFFLVTLAIASSSIGLAVAAMALADTSIRREWRRTWIAFLPVFFYLLWFGFFGRSELEGDGSMRVNATGIPRYVADAAAGALGGLTGLGLEWGRLLTVAAVALAIWRRSSLSRHAITLATGALVYWALIALARAHLGAAASSRYVYFGAVLIVLLLVEALRSVRIDARAAVFITIVTLTAVVANVHELRSGARWFRARSSVLSAELAALELARTRVDPRFRPDPERAPRLVAGGYFAAVDDFGSPADDADELLAKPEPDLHEADRVLIAALNVTPRRSGRASAASAPDVTTAVGGEAHRSGGCVRFDASSPAAAVEITSGSRLVVRARGAPVRLWLRRLAPTFRPQPLAAVPPGASVALALPRVAVAGQWHVRLAPTAIGASALACGRPATEAAATAAGP